MDALAADFRALIASFPPPQTYLEFVSRSTLEVSGKFGENSQEFELWRTILNVYIDEPLPLSLIFERPGHFGPDGSYTPPQYRSTVIDDYNTPEALDQKFLDLKNTISTLSKITADIANQFFKFVANQAFFHWQLDTNSCAQRTQTMRDFALLSGLDPESISLLFLKYAHKGRWAFHMALGLEIDGEITVIDPAEHPSPVSLKEWVCVDRFSFKKFPNNFTEKLDHGYVIAQMPSDATIDSFDRGVLKAQPISLGDRANCQHEHASRDHQATFFSNQIPI